MSESKSKLCSFTTPVLFLVFNRPGITKQVFEAIRQVKPTYLYVAADGPRKGKEDEVEKVREVREIVTAIDWDCEVKTLFRDKNMGCKIAVSSAINWFFENTEEGIILEDDCLPSQSFFWFCQELLEKYRNDARVFTISGNNFLFGHKRTNYSYYFSRYNHCWGWATWRRAWCYYDGEAKIWPEVKNGNWLKDILGRLDAAKYWSNIFQRVYENKINSWSYPWTFSCWMQGGLSIIPNANLVSNLGFGPDSTHTKGRSKFANMAIMTTDFPLKHPSFIIKNTQADNFVQRTHFHTSNIFLRITKKFLRKGKKCLKVITK